MELSCGVCGTSQAAYHGGLGWGAQSLAHRFHNKSNSLGGGGGPRGLTAWDVGSDLAARSSRLIQVLPSILSQRKPIVDGVPRSELFANLESITIGTAGDLRPCS